MDPAALALAVVQMQAASLGQGIGTAVARQQIDAQRAVADLVKEAAASPPAPPGQGEVVDVRV